MIKAAFKKVGEEPEAIEIENAFESFHMAVNGHVERIGLEGVRIAMLVNEDGQPLQLPINFITKVHGEVTHIVGNALFVGIDEDGEFRSLNDFEMNWLWLRFREAGHATDDKMGAYKLWVLGVN